MKIKTISLSVLLLLFYNSCSSQLRLQSIVSYDFSYGITTGSLDNYIPDKAFNGLHFHWRHFFARDFSLGLSSGWSNFKKQLPRDVYETDRGTVSAVQIRYFRSIPLLITGYYYLRSLHYVMPYIGGGAGSYFLRYDKYYGVFNDHQSSIRFGLRPEIGIVIPFKKSGFGLIINERFNKVFYSHKDITNLIFFESTIGIYFGNPVFDDSFMKKSNK